MDLRVIFKAEKGMDMAKGTIVKTFDVKNFKTGDAYSSRMLLDNTNSQSEKMQVNYGTLAAGANLLPAGKHDDYDEIYIITKGKCRLELDGQWHDVAAGDVIFIPRGVKHGLDNTGETQPVELYAILPFTPKPGQSGVYDSRIKAWGKSYLLE